METLIENNLSQIKFIFKKYGAVSAYVFGSAAINNMNENSDVDFLFSFPPNTHYELYTNNYFAIIEDLEKLLNVEVDLVAEKTLQNPYLIQKINSQKIKLI